MNGVDANPDAQVGKEERGIWHKRLRLRKTSFSFPAERNAVKEERNVTDTGMPKKRPRSLNTFTCSSCDDGIFFSPGELAMHFKIVHGGKGSPPMFPCDACGFSSPAFTTLQQHRMQHEGCLFVCEICEDNVQLTLPQLAKHCQAQHALDGQYECPKCKRSFREMKQFVCHSCCVANGNARKNKHMDAACRQRWSRRNWWRKRAPVKQDSKLPQELLPNPEPQWTSQLLPFSTPGLMHDYGVLMDPEKTLEETQQYLERTICGGKNWPASFKGEPDLVTPHPSQTNAKCTQKNKLSGFMEKNNISVPPDCTTKVVRFKMVDGKRHVVLKVIPSNKQDVAKDARAVKAADRQDRSDDVRSQVTPRSSPSIRKKQEGCAAQQDFLSSVVERIKSQQRDGCNNQEHAAVRLDARSTFSRSSDIRSLHAKNNATDCQAESEENFTACQGDSGCHSDLTSDAGSLEERCGARLLSTADQSKACSISGFDCMSPSSGSPLKDLHECQSEDGGLLFHGNADECTNNMDPRERLVPVGQRESCSAPVDELPLTTVIHLLDEARADRTGSDEALRDFTHAGVANQRSEPASTFEDSNCSTSVPAAVSGSSEPSLNRQRTGDTSSEGSPISKSHKHPPHVLFWEPAPRDAPATLRLIPHSSSQSVKIPRDSQPVIVLNHPDSDIPEVTNIMRVVHRHRGAVRRVLLSRKTLKALSESDCGAYRDNLLANCHASHRTREWPNGTVKERFSLKLRLKRVCGRKYTVVPTASESVVLQPTFKCWFCGRLFANQEAWVGHGQRHLMEATRGWNQLFSR